jgi:phenylpropionate dioxygenase-like ring-hydroxylating dioxygenase large terminal subunit
MLSAEDNETLVRVGEGTPMGQLMRRFWFPALLSEEVAERDGRPARVRLLGENLVAFRDSEGRIGLLQENCPHRGASLALAVNEECGLRCLYHGWKFGVDGECLDIPTEVPDSTLKNRVKAKAYATREAGGVVWAYMGPPAEQPAFPEFEWLSMPADKVMAFKVLEDCNYAQAVEGTIDSAHAGVLHRESPWGGEAKYPHEKDLTPKLEVEYAPYGLRYGAVRKMGDGRNHVRITQVVAPFYTLIPQDGAGPRKDRRLVNAFVPRDDVSTWHIQWFFDPTQPVDRAHRIDEGGHWVDENFRKKLNIDNWYQQDREMMRTTNMSGIRGILTQDHAVSETQGRILDRTKEHLGTSDVAVVAWRRLLLRTARALAEKGEAPGLVSSDIDWGRIKAATIVFGADQTWKEVAPLGEEGRHLPAVAA